MQIILLFLSASRPLLLALCSPGVLKFLNWILEFSERYSGSYIIIKSVFLWGNKDWDFLFCGLANIISLSYWDNLCDMLCILYVVYVQYVHLAITIIRIIFFYFPEHLNYLLNICTIYWTYHASMSYIFCLKWLFLPFPPSELLLSFLLLLLLLLSYFSCVWLCVTP